MVFWGIVWAVVTVTVAAAAMVADGPASFLVVTSVLARDLRQVDAA
ncbi:MAG: hypothetical protein IH898_00635 [Planctomycetes bacterium]|nr:hypothetical protein [Planctomycetota bacterium]